MNNVLNDNTPKKPTRLHIIAVDDDENNIEIIHHLLSKAGHDVAAFLDAESAFQYLCENTTKVDVILLDKHMPVISGLELLKRIKATPELSFIPVILQTSDNGVDDAKEGLALGAYYYLTKPFDNTTLLSLVNAAAREHTRWMQLRSTRPHQGALLAFAQHTTFSYRTPEDAYLLAATLSECAVNKEESGLVLLELLINAVEHGLLGFNYQEKRKLLQSNEWERAINEKLNSGTATLSITSSFQKNGNQACVTICDPGKGFDWKIYKEFDPANLTDPNGRGIATLHHMGADIRYKAPGNEVSYYFEIESNAFPSANAERLV